MSFADLGVSRPVTDALKKRGIVAPFAVQELVIADVLAGRDVLVQSPTGSGKTLAFGLPIADLLEPNGRKPAALVLAPTRELATQIVDELRDIARVRGLTIAPVYGGVGLEKQAKLARRAHIVVATPGRLEDLLHRRALSLEHVQILVIDEADRMLDMGFKPAVDRIVARTPRDRQTLFFSATLEAAAGKQARAYTRDARRHVHEPKGENVGTLSHRFVHLSHHAKVDALVDALRDSERGRTLVFVRTKRGADRLVKRLGKHRLHAVAMHGNKSQPQRQKALDRFTRGDVDTLVATDVAARGIDVDDITHVVNFDSPEDRDAYVHRTGRTARAGRDGTSISFVLPDQARDMRRIAATLGLSREFDHERRGHTNGDAGRPPASQRRPSNGRNRRYSNSRSRR
jgi:ATP-dependent RNA helicase RhlE